MYYREHLDLFSSPKKGKVSHLLVPPQVEQGGVEDSTPAWELARREAESALDEVRKGKPFLEIARGVDLKWGRKCSHGPVWRSIDDPDDPYLRHAGSLEEGEISEVIRSPRGYIVLYVEEIKPAVPKPLPDVRDHVRKCLLDELRKEEKTRIQEEICRDLNLTVRREALPDRPRRAGLAGKSPDKALPGSSP